MPTQGKGSDVSRLDKDSACAPPITSDQVAILRLLAEQQAIPLDQLALFLDSDESSVFRLVKDFELRGWVEVDEILAGQSPWVWLLSSGARLSGTGFSPVKPAVCRLPHARAINEARLSFLKQTPDGRWVCERQLRRDYGSRLTGHLPDAVFEIHNEHGDLERLAIEVELSRKEPDYLRRIIAEHTLRYDAVVYLCSKGIARFMSRLRLTSEYPTLIIRELFEPVRELHHPGFRIESAPLRRRDFREPTAPEVGILRLLSEQGAIPLDQLARFLACEEPAARRIVLSLEKASFVKRARPLGSESEWVWAGTRGTRLSGTGLWPLLPKVGSLPKFRTLNEIRLQMEESQPDAQWVSGRMLRRRVGRKGSAPAAALKVGGERHAIEVRLGQVRKPTIEELFSRRSREYDAVIFFCAPRAYSLLKFLQSQGRWPGLRVQMIPGAAPRPRGRLGREVNPSEAVSVAVLVERLRKAVEADELLPSRARSIAGYLLLSACGIPQGARRTTYELERECQVLELPCVRLDFDGTLWVADLQGVSLRLRKAVEADELLPSRARSIAGYLLLSAAGVSQGAHRTMYQLERACSKLLGEKGARRSVTESREEALAPLTHRELVIARMAVEGMTDCTIGHRLGLGERWIERNLGRVYRKLGISGRGARARLPAALAELEAGREPKA